MSRTLVHRLLRPAAVVAVLSAGAAHAEPPVNLAFPGEGVATSTANPDYVGRPYFTIDPRFLPSGFVELGDGVNMADPRRPRLAGKTPFQAPLKSGDAGRMVPFSVIDKSVYRESMSAREEALVLTEYFKGTYGLTSVDQALEIAQREQRTSHSVYVLMEHSGQAQRYPGNKQVWPETPIAETLDDARAVRSQFLYDYGSHFVYALTYGFRIAIRGKINTTDSDRQVDFSAAFKGTFGRVGAEGGIDTKYANKLTSSDVDLYLEITSGGVDPRGRVVLTSFEDIVAFLKSLQAGDIEIAVFPIRAELRSFWNTLDPEWVRLRAIFSPDRPFEVPPARNGVPAGTVIAWHPPAPYLENLTAEDDASVRIVPPPGWAICNGENGTPDLRERFVMGTDTYTETPATGGAATHGHTASAGKPTKTATAKGGAFAKHSHARSNHAHGITVKTGANLPPYSKLVYIMKLSDE